MSTILQGDNNILRAPYIFNENNQQQVTFYKQRNSQQLYIIVSIDWFPQLCHFNDKEE